MNVKNIVFIVLSVGFMLGMIVSGVISVRTLEDDIVAQEQAIENLEKDIAYKTADVETQQADVVQATTGFDEERVEKDTEIAESFISTVMTWDTWDEYEAARQECMSVYGLSPDSDFMQIFMPEVPNSTLEGKDYNSIDTYGLNVKFEELTPYVTNINAGTYSYFSLVEWSTHDANGAEAVTTSIFTYSVDADGNLINIDADTIQM